MDGKVSLIAAGNNLLRSFAYALAGLCHALRHERNLRIDFVAGSLVLYFSRYYELARVEKALLVLMVGFVITCELINTAIENTVDLESSTYHSLARIAKDVAAGAVLVSAVSSVIAGYFLLWDLQVLQLIWRDIINKLYLWLPVFLAALAFIFVPGSKKHP